jgi:hypothetical protein
MRGRDSSVGSDELGNWGSIPYSGKRFVSRPQHPDRLCGPPSLLTNEYSGGGLSPWIKRPGREADYSAPATTEVKNGGALVYHHSHIRLHAVVLN